MALDTHAKPQTDEFAQQWCRLRDELESFVVGTAGYTGNDWVFRGEPRWYRNVLPLMDRALGRDCPGGIHGRLQAELLAMLRFHQHAPRYLDDIQRSTLQEYMQAQIVMRHYGAPTRLLDWTESPWIALYFASGEHLPSGGETSEASSVQDGRILAFDRRQLENVIKERFEYESRAHAEMVPNEAGYIIPKMLTTQFADTVKEWVVCYHRHAEKFPRLIVQQGLFTLASKPWVDHWETVNKLIPNHTRVIRVPGSLKLAVRRYLAQMGLTAASLFPGIEGVSQEISDYVVMWHSGRF